MDGYRENESLAKFRHRITAFVEEVVRCCAPDFPLPARQEVTESIVKDAHYRHIGDLRPYAEKIARIAARAHEHNVAVSQLVEYVWPETERAVRRHLARGVDPATLRDGVEKRMRRQVFDLSRAARIPTLVRYAAFAEAIDLQRKNKEIPESALTRNPDRPVRLEHIAAGAAAPEPALDFEAEEATRTRFLFAVKMIPFREPNPPHQSLPWAFARMCKGVKTKKIVGMRDMSLREITQEWVRRTKEYKIASEFSRRLGKKVEDALTTTRLRNQYSHLFGRVVGETCLSDYMKHDGADPHNNPSGAEMEEIVANWIEAVQDRVLPALFRLIMGEDTW